MSLRMQIDLGELCSDSFLEVTSALQYLLLLGKAILGFHLHLSQMLLYLPQPSIPLSS